MGFWEHGKEGNGDDGIDLGFCFSICPSGPESVRKYSVGFKFLVLPNSFYK